MSHTLSPSKRFQEFRERAGLTYDEVAKKMGLSIPCVRDIESYEDEIYTLYSLRQIQGFCLILGVHPSELLCDKTDESPISAFDLVQKIRENCTSHQINLDQFEDTVGWHLGKMMDPPSLLLDEINIDGIQDLCRELGINWERVILSL